MRAGFQDWMDDSVLTLNQHSLPLILARPSALAATANICSDKREETTTVVFLYMSSNPKQLFLEKLSGMLTGTTQAR